MRWEAGPRSAAERAAASCGFALAWAALLCLARSSIHAGFGSEPLAGAAVLGFPGQVAFGLLLGLAVLGPVRWLAFAGALATLLALAANVAAYHYEAVFGRLPGVSFLYYLREAGQLRASLDAHAPPLFIALEIAVLAALLFWVARALGTLRLPRPAALACAGVAAASGSIALLALAPGVLSPSLRAGLHTPLSFLLESARLRHAFDLEDARISARDVWSFQRQLGHAAPFGGVDADFPLCGDTAGAGGGSGNGRSAILLILESVGARELAWEIDGRPVMPGLRRIAEEGLAFRDAIAVGTKSAHALPAILTGQPAQSAGNLLWRTPLNQLEGFPRRLRQRGYDTVYFHGGDLAFERQREFLAMVGFQELFELDRRSTAPVYGWGHADGEMFRRLRRWVEDRDDAAPYLATLFSLSTHDPYLVPPEWPRRFTKEPQETRFRDEWNDVVSGESRERYFAESLAYLDAELLAFYDWYRRVEAPRGTRLVIVGDHVAHFRNDALTRQGRAPRFDVPLIVSGLTAAERERLAPASQRPASQFDVPATLAGLLGLARGACDQGLDLLAPDAAWPAQRVRHAVAGDELEWIYLTRGPVRARFDRRGSDLQVAGAAGPGSEAARSAGPELAAFVDTLLRVSYFLMEHDAFAPPAQDAAPRPVLPAVIRPFFVSHRGNVAGPEAPERENRLAALHAAVEAGFEWIEVDVQITRDGVPVLVHDAEVPEASGERRAIASLTLAELRRLPGMRDVPTLDEAFDAVGGRVNLLVEAKPQRHVARSMALVREIARVLAQPERQRERAAGRRVIVDSFSRFLAAAIQGSCDCEVGLDAPFGEPVTRAWLVGASRAGFDWVYLNKHDASAETVTTAHALGLRVMLYTLEQEAELAPFATSLPDGVITDYALVAGLPQPRDGPSYSYRGRPTRRTH